MPTFLRFTCFLLILTVNSFGQTKQEKQLIRNLDQFVAEKYSAIAPGCVVLVAKNGKVIYNKALGMANLELSVPMRPEMVFRIGSITKQYTAIAILQLVEQGKISLQDSLQKFIKGFPYKKYSITIENLLTHTSGIADYEILDFHIPNAIRIDFPVKQLIDSLSILQLDFVPSSKYSYSNSNYLLLGYIIEQVSGKPYQDYLQQHVFNAAGLSNTYYSTPTRIINNRVSGYTKDNSSYRNADYISTTQVFSAGALLSSVEDLFKWHQALYMHKLIKKETLEKAVTPFRFANGSSSEYSFGWFVRDWKGSKSIGHGGAIDGFRSMEIYLPEQDMFIAGLSNSDDDRFFGLFEDMTGMLIGTALPTAYKDLKVPDNVLETYVGTYVSTEQQYVNDSIKIYKEGDRLYCDLSNKSGMHMGLFAQSPTLFFIPVVKRKPTTIEFIVDQGIVKGAYWIQERKNEIRKVK